MTIWMFLIVCPLVGLAAYVDAIAGGGGLISLPAYLIAGLPAVGAIATNKLSACMGGTMAFFRYARSGFIPWKLALPSIALALVGAVGGASLARMIPDTVYKVLLLVILPLTALYVLRNKSLSSDKPELPFLPTLLISLGVAFLMGLYDGIYGPGTGVFIILLLTSFAHMRLKQANGICKAINWASNVSSLTVYLFSGNVLVPLGLCAGLFSIIGSYLGTRTFEKKGVVSVRPIMLTVLAIFFARILLELLGIL